jgi:hypothetical protein
MTGAPAPERPHRWRPETVASIRAGQTTGSRSPYVIAFPHLPEGAVVTEIEVSCDCDHYLLHYEVPDPNGELLLPCGEPGCAECARL